MIVQLAIQVLRLMANLANMTILLTLATAFVVAGLVLVILYLLAWNRTAAAYEAQPEQSATAPDVE